MEKVLYIILFLISATCVGGLITCWHWVSFKLREDGNFPNPYFLESILPLIVGLCIEGLLFVGMITLVQKAAERSELAKLRNAVMAELKFLFDVMHNRLLHSSLGPLRDTKIDFSSPGKLAKSMACVQSAAQQRRIDAGTGSYPDDDFSEIARSVADELQSKAKVHLRRLELLTPVVARLGADYVSKLLSITGRLYDLTRAEGFDQAQIDTWGKNMPFEYAYSRVIDLLRNLSALRVT
jgi:hypothetical protein